MITAEHMAAAEKHGRLGLVIIQPIIGEQAPALNVELLYLLFFSALTV